MRCNATLVAGDPAAVVAEAERWAADGFSTFKLKLGTGDDAAQVRAVREALGTAGADPRRRQRRLGPGDGEADARRRSSRYEVELAEQPVASVEEAAELAASTTIPLAGRRERREPRRRGAGGRRSAPSR